MTTHSSKSYKLGNVHSIRWTTWNVAIQKGIIYYIKIKLMYIPLLSMARGHPPPHCENTQVLREAITEDDDDELIMFIINFGGNKTVRNR